MHKLTLITPLLICKFLTILILLTLAGCGSTAPYQAPESNQLSTGGGYYLDDGPGHNPPSNLDLIPDATPRYEPIRQANTTPYVALGQTFYPMKTLSKYKKQGIASWYGRRYHGNNTASGEVYDMYAMTAAHPTLPLPSYARVTNVSNGKSIVVRINDRGPFLSDRLIDLSYTAAYKLDIIQNGHGEVIVESILPDETNFALQSPPNLIKAGNQQKTNENNTFYIQLGAFGKAVNAQGFVTRIKKELPWLDRPINVLQANGLFKIKAGPYKNQLLAKQHIDSITQHLSISPIIVID